MSEEIQDFALSIADLATDRTEATIRLQRLVVEVQLEERGFNNERLKQISTELQGISLHEAKELSFKAALTNNHCECYAKGYLDGIRQAIQRFTNY